MKLLTVLLALAATALGHRTAATSQTAAGSGQDVERLRAYHTRIVATTKALAPAASLADLVRPVMRLAESRSVAATAAAENRSAPIAIAFHVNGWPLHALVPEAREWPRAERRPLLLRGRGDLTQHFTVSAVIAAAAGTPVAAAAGLYKEIDDARQGSGFSFADLAADRAGTMFGETATRTGDSARRLQARISAGLSEGDLMPDITGLPDGLSEAEFTRRYGGVGAPAYNDIVNDIDRRISALALFR
jgi:uncharacterized protein YfiM (DUF2279 family)